MLARSSVSGGDEVLGDVAGYRIRANRGAVRVVESSNVWFTIVVVDALVTDDDDMRICAERYFANAVAFWSGKRV